MVLHHEMYLHMKCNTSPDNGEYGTHNVDRPRTMLYCTLCRREAVGREEAETMLTTLTAAPRGRNSRGRNPRLERLGASLCTGETHPSKTRVGLCQTPGFIDSYCAGWALGPRPQNEDCVFLVYLGAIQGHQSKDPPRGAPSCMNGAHGQRRAALAAGTRLPDAQSAPLPRSLFCYALRPQGTYIGL